MRNNALGMWVDIVREYPRRQLSFEYDRLNAISSLAERLSRILQDEYIGGIWKKNLLMCLQWSHAYEDGYLKSTREDACSAPTWSWACIGNPIREHGSGLVVEPFSAGNSVTLVRIDDLVWTIGGSNDGKIVLSGRILRGYAYFSKKGPDVSKDMITMTEELEELPQKKITHHPDCGTEAWKNYSAFFVDQWWLHICGEKSGQPARVILPIYPDARECLIEEYLYLRPLADYPIVEEATVMSRQAGRLFGLILKEVSDGTFQRVGCTSLR